MLNIYEPFELGGKLIPPKFLSRLAKTKEATKSEGKHGEKRSLLIRCEPVCVEIIKIAR